MPNIKTRRVDAFISFLDCFFSKTISNVVLRHYNFQHDGISRGVTTYNLSLKHYKKLLHTESFTQQKQYFVQAEKKDYYFDCLTVYPFTVCSFILPDDIFAQEEKKVVSFCQNILNSHDGYCGIISDVEKISEINTSLSYSEQQHLKYFSPAVSHINIKNEICVFFFSSVEQYDYFFFNHCTLPHFNDSYISQAFYKKNSFGQNFIQICKRSADIFLD